MINKKLKKEIITSIVFFTFAGISLSTNLYNTSKLNSSLYNRSSLNNNDIKITNEDSNILTINNSPNLNSITKARTTIELNTSNQNIILNTFPFQIENNRTILESIIRIGGSLPSNFSVSRDVVFLVQNINNLAQSASNPKNSGAADIVVTVNNYIDSNGNVVNPNTVNFKPLENVIRIRNFKSAEAHTSYDKISSFVPGNFYASDYANKEVSLNNVFKLNNAIENISPQANTRFIEVNRTFDNPSGVLEVSYVLKNYFDQNGKYISIDRFASSQLSGFKKVPGATSLTLKNNMKSVSPSTIADDLRNDHNSYLKYFNFINLPGPTPTITGINNIFPNDEEGTLAFNFTINGKYFDSSFIERTSSSEGDLLDTTIIGFVEPNNMIPIIVGSTVGGVALIAIVALAIFFMNRSRESKNKISKNQKSNVRTSNQKQNFKTHNNVIIPAQNISHIKTQMPSTSFSNKSLYTSIPKPIGDRPRLHASKSSERPMPPKLKN
ncbi:MAG: hypothetical protein ACRDCD_02855 [Mycoplasmoidaceae bacterium]